MFNFNFLGATKLLKNGKQHVEKLVQKLSGCEFNERNRTGRNITKLLREQCGSTLVI